MGSKGVEEMRRKWRTASASDAHFAGVAAHNSYSVFPVIPFCVIRLGRLRSSVLIRSVLAPTADALDSGRLAYELLPNIMPVNLLTLYLPIADPDTTTIYLREAERALLGFRLNRVWYSLVERGRRSVENGLDFYDRIRAEFAVTRSL
jgi:hypothetical protein